MSVNPIVPMTYVDEDASSGSADGANMPDGHNNNKRQSGTPAASGRSKRGRKATGDAIVDAMLEIAAASKLRAAAIMKSEDQFSISKCIKVLDEIQDVDQQIYFFALELFENPDSREIFISLKNERRLPWLQGKYGASSSTDTSANMDDIDLQLDEMELAAAAAGYYYFNSLSRMPPLASSQRRRNFMAEVLDGPDDMCREMFRMDKHVFHKLCSIFRHRGLLRDTCGVMIEEQVAIFLNIIGHSERIRVVQERFQHSGETISRYFNNVLKSIRSLSREFLQPPPQTTPMEIHCSKRHEERKDWLFASVEGVSVEDLSEFDDEADIPELGPSMQEEIAFSVRESMAGAMWNDFINTWDEW
ncbi:hypothetical protein LINPERPRIM_LOCUS5689 [Linum perenne]